MTPKEVLLNGLDDLDLDFIEGENELEFELDDYSFTVTYSLESTDNLFSEEDDEIKGGKALKILSINAYNNLENEDLNVNVDDDIQKLFSDYYDKTLNDVNFGGFSDVF
jgi:hypothetical protein